jgi:predicted MFS family arabinose efflux permease
LTLKGWSLLLVLAGIQFSNALDFTIMLPLGTRYQRELDINAQWFGFVVAAYPLAACLSGLFAAVIIDRFDRKRALLTLFAGFIAGTLLCGLASNFGQLCAGRFIAGIFGGLLGAVVLAIIGDVFHERCRGLATGVVMTGFGLATIVGIPVGLTLAQHFRTGMPFIALAGFSAGTLVLAAVLLPSFRHHLDTSHTSETPRPTMSFKEVVTHPTHMRAYALTLTLMLGSFTLFPYLPTFLVLNVGWAENEVLWMYVWGGLAVLATSSLIGRIADRFGKLPVFRVLVLLALPTIIWLTNLGPTPLAATLPLTTLFMVLTSARWVPAMAMITSSARPAYRGSFMFINSSVQQMGMGLADLLGGAVLRQTGADQPIQGFAIAGLLACAATVVSVFLAGRIRPVEDAASIEIMSAPVDSAA